MIAATKNERWIYCSDNIEDCWKVWIWFFDSDRFKHASANSYISNFKPLLEAQCDFDHAVGNKKPETNLGFNGMNYFIYTSHHFTPHGRCKLDKLTSLPMCGFIAQSVEHRTDIAEVTGSNPVEAPDFFRLLPSNCLNWKIYSDYYSSLSSTTAVQIWIISYILHIISLLTGDMNSINWSRSQCVAS